MKEIEGADRVKINYTVDGDWLETVRGIDLGPGPTPGTRQVVLSGPPLGSLSDEPHGPRCGDIVVCVGDSGTLDFDAATGLCFDPTAMRFRQVEPSKAAIKVKPFPTPGTIWQAPQWLPGGYGDGPSRTVEQLSWYNEESTAVFADGGQVSIFELMTDAWIFVGHADPCGAKSAQEISRLKNGLRLAIGICDGLIEGYIKPPVENMAHLRGLLA